MINISYSKMFLDYEQSEYAEHSMLTSHGQIWMKL